jgi:hypothetical protein
LSEEFFPVGIPGPAIAFSISLPLLPVAMPATGFQLQDASKGEKGIYECHQKIEKNEILEYNY